MVTGQAALSSAERASEFIKQASASDERMSTKWMSPSIELMSAERVSTEQTSAEQTSAEQTSAERIAAEQTSAEQVSASRSGEEVPPVSAKLVISAQFLLNKVVEVERLAPLLYRSSVLSALKPGCHQD